MWLTAVIITAALYIGSLICLLKRILHCLGWEVSRTVVSGTLALCLLQNQWQAYRRHLLFGNIEKKWEQKPKANEFKTYLNLLFQVYKLAELFSYIFISKVQNKSVWRCCQFWVVFLKLYVQAHGSERFQLLHIDLWVNFNSWLASKHHRNLDLQLQGW